MTEYPPRQEGDDRPEDVRLAAAARHSDPPGPDAIFHTDGSVTWPEGWGPEQKQRYIELARWIFEQDHPGEDPGSDIYIARLERDLVEERKPTQFTESSP